MSTDFTGHVFAIVDKRDAAGFAALFAPDGRFVFGNSEPIVGPAAIAEATDAFFANVLELRHEIVNNWEVGADTVAELTVEYHRLDDRYVTVPGVTIFTRDDAGLITHYRIFVDLAPLFAV
jgi:ketosteroid isomerase-like protein